MANGKNPTAEIKEVLVADSPAQSVTNVTATYTYDGFKNNGKQIIELQFLAGTFEQIDYAGTTPLNGGFGTATAQVPYGSGDSVSFSISFEGDLLAEQSASL